MRLEHLAHDGLPKKYAPCFSLDWEVTVILLDWRDEHMVMGLHAKLAASHVQCHGGQNEGGADVAPLVFLMIFIFCFVEEVLSSEKRLGYMVSGSFI